jgi:nucleotide-binding universal stress UspA family protein
MPKTVQSKNGRPTADIDPLISVRLPLEASELLRHLQRHSLIANLSTRDEDDIPTAIAAEAEAWRASVLIMGAYGHSRIREIVFGGVTRFMLTATRVPTIMVH